MRAAAGSLYKGISDLLNLPSIMYPDIYNQQEKQAADTYKFYGKVGGGLKVDGGYLQPRCWTRKETWAWGVTDMMGVVRALPGWCCIVRSVGTADAVEMAQSWRQAHTHQAFAAW